MKLNHLTEIFQNRTKIWEGLKNKLFKKEHIEEIYNQRIQVCKGCECYDDQGYGCIVSGTQPCCNINNGGCGCSLSLKLRVLSESCPKSKWIAVVTDQEEEMIKDQISNNEAKDNQ